jgi:CubicO group peptidase (beta-lactamase class C family)
MPDGRGTLRVRASGAMVPPDAMWIQAASPGGASAYASPARLTPTGRNSWRGTVRPVDERFSLYLAIQRDSVMGMQARFRNPEGNFGGGRVFRVVTEAQQIGLVDAVTSRRRFTQAYDSAARTISFDFGVPLVATPRNAERTVDFVPRVEQGGPYAYRVPPSLGDGWASSTATAQGMQQDTLAALVQRILNTNPLDDSAARVHSIVVARHGVLVLDEYFFGYTAHRVHDLRSASKTLTSILLGVAMRRGVAISSNTKVTPAGATIGQLLTHTSGLACDDNDDSSPGNEDVMQSQRAEPDWYRYAMALPQKHGPGQTYAYCSAGINLVGGAITRASGTWLPEYFDRELARPLGIATYGMNLMPTGDGYAGGGMHMRPRDFLKFGQLYLNGGLWNGRRLVSRAWVETSTRRQQPDTLGADDGFAWHRHTLKVRGCAVPAYEASGNGGQYLIVVPRYDLVAVVTAGMYGQARLWLPIRQELIARYVAGAVVRKAC